MTLSTDKITGVLQISGTLDIDAANGLREALLDCLLHQGEIVADISELDGCDAAGLQVLLAGRRDAMAAGKPFRFTAPSHVLAQTALALGFSIDAPEKVRGEEHSDAS